MPGTARTRASRPRQRLRLAGRLVAGRVRVEAHRQQALARVAEIDVLQVDQRPRQQTGADQQRQRQGQLADHDGAADAQPGRRPGDAAALIAQSGRHRRLGDAQRRQHAEREPGEDRDGDDEAPTRASRPRRAAPPRPAAGAATPWRSTSAMSEPGQAAGRRQAQTFGQQLPDQPGRGRRRGRAGQPPRAAAPSPAPATGCRDWRRRSAAPGQRPPSSTSRGSANSLNDEAPGRRRLHHQPLIEELAALPFVGDRRRSSGPAPAGRAR